MSSREQIPVNSDQKGIHLWCHALWQMQKRLRRKEDKEEWRTRMRGKGESDLMKADTWKHNLKLPPNYCSVPSISRTNSEIATNIAHTYMHWSPVPKLQLKKMDGVLDLQCRELGIGWLSKSTAKYASILGKSCMLLGLHSRKIKIIKHVNPNSSSLFLVSLWYSDTR